MFNFLSNSTFKKDASGLLPQYVNIPIPELFFYLEFNSIQITSLGFSLYLQYVTLWYGSHPWTKEI